MLKEHFFAPRNAGPAEAAHAIGDVGSLSCGDALRLSLRIDPESETILETGFQTLGCAAAIASNSTLTEIIQGRPLGNVVNVSGIGELEGAIHRLSKDPLPARTAYSASGATGRARNSAS